MTSINRFSTRAGLAASRFVLILLLLSPALSQAQDAVGRVIRSSGDVSAVDAAGTSRPLSRGAEFFVDETITTGTNGSVVLRFTDGARMTIEADTQFSVNDYQYDGEGGAADSIIMSVVQGSLRTVSGTIGEGAGDTYELNTPTASIGIRGTEYAVNVTVGGRTIVIVFDGGIDLTPSGSGGAPVQLGTGGDSDAGEVEADGTVRTIDLQDLTPEQQQTVQRLANLIVATTVEDALDDTTALAARLQNGALLTDEQGRVLDASTREEYLDTVRRIIGNNPGAFDDLSVRSVSPN